MGVVPINWSQFTRQRGQNSFFAYFRSTSKSEHSPSSTTFRRQLDAVSANEQIELLQAHVRAMVAKVLGWSSQAIPLEEGFFEIGMDSLTSIELRNRLQNTLESRLPSTLAFDYPTVNALLPYLAQELGIGQFDEAIPMKEDGPLEPEPEIDNLEELASDEIRDLMSEKLDALDKWLD